jgi:all-trans-retinol 13,14-reductase
MIKYDIIIIGGGLGGLQCGYILSKQGYSVCVLEKNAQTGGCLQTFRRGSYAFDTGFHYVGGLDEGQPLYQFFDFFGLMNLPWHKLDKSGFEEVILNGKSYLFTNGYEQFTDKMSEYFPQEKDNLKKYVNFLRKTSDNIFNPLIEKNDAETAKLFSISAFEYLNSLTNNKLLINVLSGTSLKMELNPKTLPLYIFAQINSSFIQSAWRLKGGGSQISDSLAMSIEKNGGIVRTNAKVTKLIEENAKVTKVEINGDEIMEAANFVADIHPALLLSLLSESGRIRNVYRKRMNRLENTFGFFTANIALKKNTVPYMNRNIYLYDNINVWNCRNYENNCALVSFQLPNNNLEYAENIDILTPMCWSEVEQWKNTTIGKRGSDYLLFKQQKAEQCIRHVKKYIPYLESNIKEIHKSTPLTYRDYTGTPFGSAYGIRKDCNNPVTTVLSIRTPVPNIYLTGQNPNFHGMLGVSFTSFLTCAEIIGNSAFFNETVKKWV